MPPNLETWAQLGRKIRPITTKILLSPKLNTAESAKAMPGVVGIELLTDFTKSHAFKVLPTANQMNWS